MPESVIRCYVGLGANLDQPRRHVEQAAQALAASPGVALLRLSPLYRSAPVESNGPDYVNAVAQVDTRLPPDALLSLLQSIECAHGRQRPYRNAPRTLDLDLLLYGGRHIDTPVLTVPHPRMHLRAFVLQPLSDLDPGLCLEQGSVHALLLACQGQRLERLPD
ncbi:2-amino-4-hydroxy-6-hydroxymethyldihydropteridine diphosphokinase [Allopusillimonas soli]|uniref:2-amino-4-hydroxy-6-hydroxymethyldihydropteridine pyrophosphokinase n=2 Tax=Allopusillimonas soli TaxID=659016 RepID=A0A853FIE4_9BURK|nr:2-amino-4-hydroxy-6-hydroxymethyldihydropteridine diphosphokinase [Allopusillimonas soli]TEA71824.1 2-amino-4-hydroxy-6-hydroxymethyldihydropteridine diphosphokinase [Allopusillimonas soli]